MIRFLTDEDFTHAIITGVRHRLPQLDIIRVQDAGLRTFSDTLILEFAASESRIVLSHDLRTMKAHARERIFAGKSMPGLFLLRQKVIVAHAIDSIVMVAECSREGEWDGIIEHLPL